MKLNAKQLRSHQSSAVSRQTTNKNDIYIILDNVLDTYNIGSIFRLADAVAAKKIYLCGATSTPPDHRIKKSSINTTEWVEWEYTESALSAISNVKCKHSLPFADAKRQMPNIQIIAIEQSDKSIPYEKFDYQLPICLIVGNETYGVSEEVLRVCDATVELPMFGVNISLNVMVSLGIVLYQVIEKTSPHS